MGETRVDLEHLLEDLRDAYPSGIADTILTEIIANSLDSGASRITMTVDPAQSSLTVVDNGSGMQRKSMRQYHDIAASTKVRGQGIGFAGVGIKLGRWYAKRCSPKPGVAARMWLRDGTWPRAIAHRGNGASAWTDRRARHCGAAETTNPTLSPCRPWVC